MGFFFASIRSHYVRPVWMPRAVCATNAAQLPLSRRSMAIWAIRSIVTHSLGSQPPLANPLDPLSAQWVSRMGHIGWVHMAGSRMGARSLDIIAGSTSSPISPYWYEKKFLN